MELYYSLVECEVGPVCVATTPYHVVKVGLPPIPPAPPLDAPAIADILARQFPTAHIRECTDEAILCRRATQELQHYFAGTCQKFTVPLAPQGTPFQHSVWECVQTIPYGQTRTYGEIAEALGGKNLSRAVGLANGANPIPIMIPCHRVLGKGRALTGYGGGLAMKRYLLQREGAVLI